MPLAACDVQSTLNANPCLFGLNAHELEVIKTVLLCQLYTAIAGGGGGGSIVTTLSGIGDPNGVVTGNVGWLYSDLTDPNNVGFWIKTSGTGTTTVWHQLIG